DGVDGLGLGVDVDAELAAVEVGDGEPQLRDAAAGGVPVVAGVPGRLGQLVDGDLRRRDVRVAEPEVDDVLPGPTGGQLPGVDGGEDVGRQRVDPAELHTSHGTSEPSLSP